MELYKFLKSRWRINELFLKKYPHPGGNEYEFEDNTIETIEEIIDFE